MSVLDFILLNFLLFLPVLGAPPSSHPQKLKIGVSIYWRATCIVQKAFRSNNDGLFEDLDKGFLQGNLGDWLSPPRKFSLMRLESEHLGIWAYGFKLRMAEFNQKSNTELLEDLKDDLDGYLESKHHEWPFDDCVVDLLIDVKEEKNQETSAPQMSTKILNGSEGSLTKREDDDFEVVALENAWDGLPTLSAPKDTALLKNEKISRTYFHYNNPGEGVVVYVVDGYGDLNNDEFRNLKLDGVLSAGAPPFDFLTDIQDAGDHGSIMVDKIAGEHAGIAQRARIVYTSVVEGSSSVTLFSQLGALLYTYDNIINRYVDLDIPCIISIAWQFGLGRRDRGSPLLEEGDTIAKPFVEILNKLMDLDNVIMVSSAGNGKPGDPIIHYPSRLGLDAPKRRHVVVGGTDRKGLNMWQFDTKIPNFVWAPSEGIWTYGHTSADVFVEPVSGTSIAEATVAGMLAMYISLDLDSNTRLEDAITKLKTLSWKRNPEGVPIIHNGITPDQWPEKFRKIID
ncbi:hypothetical protein TWF217_010425 [Orbilia oligospora]|nr:hypothetical protein TWF217_010425 [Orbilia oligospora]KAF3262606.1 hypothetical protein TWF128_002370 [Orbilia oligospora]